MNGNIYPRKIVKISWYSQFCSYKPNENVAFEDYTTLGQESGTHWIAGASCL